MNLKKTKVMASGSKGEVLKSQVDPCAKCSKRAMANSVMCTKMRKNEEDDFKSGKKFCL